MEKTDNLEAEAQEEATEAVEETTTEAQAEGQPEAQEDGTEEQAEGAETASGESEPEANAALKSFLREDGKVDVDKLAKSYLEGQKLIGKTAKERERLNKLPELEQKAKESDFVRYLAQKNPTVAKALDEAWRREQGYSPAPQETKPAEAPNAAELERRIADLTAKGDMVGAWKVLKDTDPELNELRNMKKEIADAERRRQADAERDAINREAAEFKTKYAGSIFDAKGGVLDQEVYDKLVHDVMARPYAKKMPYEDALKITLAELGRPSVTKPKTDAAKAQAMAAPQGKNARRTPTNETLPKSPFMGVPLEKLLSGNKRK